MNISRILGTGAIAVAGALLPASAAFADPGSTTVVSYARAGVETIACTGDTAWYVTELNHEMIHQQALADGSIQFVDNDAQSFTVQLADGSGPVYSGQAAIHLSAIFPAAGRQSAPISYVFHAIGFAPDGSQFAMDEVVHAQANPDGSVSVTFDHLSCGTAQ